METISLCPFTVGHVVWQSHDRAWSLSVVVKGVFALRQEREAVLTDAQEPPSQGPGEAERTGISSGDLIPYKPRTDVLVVGSAYAPERQPVEAMVARFSVGDFTKAIGIIGDRVWQDGPDGLEPSAPAPFASMPLVYERAARGHENPVGVDLTAAPSLGRAALPNLEAADDESVAGRSVGVGPLDPSWPSRRALLVGEGVAWVDAMHEPMPEGFDFRFFNEAPYDQQIDLLRHGADIVLENLHPSMPRLATRLPILRPKAFLVANDTERATEIALRCDTICIDTDKATATLTWRGLIGLESQDPNVTVVVAAESRHRRLHYRQIEKMLREGTTSSLSETLTETHDLGKRHDSVKIRTPVATPDSAEPLFEETPIPGSWVESPRADSPFAAIVPRVFDSQIEIETARTEIKVEMPSHGSLLVEESSTGLHFRAPNTDAADRLEVSDYARITVAIERGEVGGALADYGLGLADLASLRATWTERLENDPELQSTFAIEVERARGEKTKS